MITHVAITTGGSRGLGRATTLGLAHEGYAVVAFGHIATDIAQLASEFVDTPLAERVVPMLADLRQPTECDRVMAAAWKHFGAVHSRCEHRDAAPAGTVVTSVAAADDPKAHLANEKQ